MRMSVKGAIARGVSLVLLASSMVACGFVTAPLSLATAEVAGTGVKAADYSLEQGQQAAIYVRSKAIVAADESWQFLKETGADIRASFQELYDQELYGQEQPGLEQPVQSAALLDVETEASVSVARDRD